MIDEGFIDLKKDRQSRVTLGKDEEAVLCGVVNPKTGHEQLVNLSDIEPDPEYPDSVLANARTLDTEELIAVRLKNKIGEAKEVIISHRNPIGAAAILAAGTIAVGRLWVRHRPRQ